ncbi:hypothetical protein CHS0354_018762 [Potamilus streckersoni]|uniref:MD-2-related lipid-recognition domain-containing protein n=1 Tax=Potamilus streckersoni TaxID=2493646 RepID=A0AAE0W752_9BIVA|nr:hypothetical protein CHS0354_018762 [Potamilus streckersoni]
MSQMLVLVAMSLALFAACDGFHYSTCEKVANPILSIHSLKISPTTVVIPGALSLTLQVQVHRPIMTNIRVDLTMKRKVWPFDIKIRCLSNIGSCSYNICQQLSILHNSGNVQCPLKSDKSNSNCHCPVQPGTYTIKDATFQIPKIPLGLGFAFSGTYKIKAKLTDTHARKVVGCYAVEVSIKA